MSEKRIGFRLANRDLGGDETAQLISSYRRTGVALKFRRIGRKKVAWTPRPGYIYSQVRAISARVNQNYDAWPSTELKKSYKTFIGRPIFVNHTNEDPQTARGVVVAARYCESGKDKYIECIMETDAKRFPKLAHELRTGGIDGVSMGVEAGFTICSICENKATDLHDMCSHIKFHKGEHLKNKKTGKRTLVFENCFKLGFFELSYVFDPADETAVVSRVIAASKQANGPELDEPPWSDSPSGRSHIQFHPGEPGHGHLLRVDPPGMGNIPDQITPDQWQWQHSHTTGDPANHEVINHGVAGNQDDAKEEAWRSYQADQDAKRLGIDEWDPNEDLRALYGRKHASDEEDFVHELGNILGPLSRGEGKDYSQHYVVPEDLKPHSRTSNRRGGKMRPFNANVWYKRAFDEQEAPEDVDTLRDESEDDTDLFHHWIQSPPELRAPDMDQTKRLDRSQEQEGLDEDRHVEDAEPIGMPEDHPEPHPDEGSPFMDEPEEQEDPAMPINPPEYRKSRRTNRSPRMSRYFYAEGEDESDGESASSDDIHQLLDEAEQDIDDFENGGQTDDYSGDDSEDQFGDDEGGDDDYEDEGDDEGGEPPWADDEGGDDEGYDDGGDDEGGDEEEASGDDAPPWAEKESYYRPTVNRKRSRRNRRGGAMRRTTLASRNTKARHFTADDDGHTDGGVHGEYDGSGADESQGLQEEVFISQVPGAEEVDAPSDDSNAGQSNLVEAYKRPVFDPNHYQRLADVVRSLPPAQRRAMADKMVREFTADNHQFNWRTFFEAANVPVVKKGSRYFYAEDLEDACEVDPSLSGTDVQDLKGSDFDSLALDDVETQPKDASIHAFRQFDAWLQKATGRTAARHGNANYISRAAASYCRQFQNPQAKLASLFPTLEYVLREARKVERTGMRRRAEDQSMETAKPDGNVDVEAPVKNVTDEEAQASQFDLGDFAHNAGDQLADPVLDVVDGNAGTWAPDEGTKESRRKLASGVEAMRCAEAYVRAMPATYRPDDRWRLAAMFEGKLASAVRSELRLLEAVLEDQKKAPKTARKVTAASSRGTRGIPRGLGSGTRTAGTQKLSANDPDTDGMLFM